MKTNITRKAAILGLAGLMLVGVAVPAMAYNGGTMTLKASPVPFIAINLGVLGDQVVGCQVLDNSGWFGGAVTIDNGATWVGANVHVPTAVDVSHVCIGGAAGPLADNADGVPTASDGTSWTVVGQDYIVNGCGGTRLADGTTLGPLSPAGLVTGTACTAAYHGLDDVNGLAAGSLKIGQAMLARVQVTFDSAYACFDPTGAAGNTANCDKDGDGDVNGVCSVPGSGTPCTTDQDYNVFRNTMKMGVCGASTQTFAHSQADSSSTWGSNLAAGTPAIPTGSDAGTISNKFAEAQIFEAGPLFYPGECMHGAISSLVRATYNTAVGIANTVTCDTLGGFVCFFPYPAPEENCTLATSGKLDANVAGNLLGASTAATAVVPFVGIAGEIQWSINAGASWAGSCAQSGVDDGWQYFGGSEAGVNANSPPTPPSALDDINICLAAFSSTPCPGIALAPLG